MKLSELSDHELQLKTESLAKGERRLNLEVLHCLKEVEARLLYAELGFSSLYEYATKKLLYSEGAAHRRIASMRLLKTLPLQEQTKVEAKLSSGELNITHLTLLQGSFQAAKKSGEIIPVVEKIKLIDSISAQSKSETEKRLAERFPNQVKPAPFKTELGGGRVRISLEFNEAEFNEIRELQNRTAEIDIKALFIKSVRMELKNFQKKTPTEKSESERVKAESSLKADLILSAGGSTAPSGSPSNSKKMTKSESRYLSREVKRQVWIRDEGICTFKASPGIRCESRFGLEIDHIYPFALGGANEANNLRLRCRVHNKLHAVRIYGRQKMDGFARS